MTVQVKAKLALAKEYLTLESQTEPELKMGFAFNPLLTAIFSIVLGFLYFSFEQHKVKFFVYFSIIINLLHPFLIKTLRKDTSLRMLLLQGTLIPAIMFDTWTLFYPHKTFVYYIPQLLSLTAKLVDLIVDSEWRVQVTQELCKFQCKIEVLVVIFCFIGAVIKLKWIWFKIIKFIFLSIIFRVKYWRHYACQLALNEIHFLFDYLGKTLLLRQQYQQIYSKISLLGNGFNSNQYILL